MEKVEFKMMLPNINLLYLSAHVLIIMDSTYSSRFWTQFEAWLSMQECTGAGLQPAAEANRRSAIVCIHNAEMQFDGAKLERTWALRSVAR